MTPKEVYAGLIIARTILRTTQYDSRPLSTALEAINTALRHLEPLSK
jgi:hypothetical protein